MKIISKSPSGKNIVFTRKIKGKFFLFTKSIRSDSTTKLCETSLRATYVFWSENEDYLIVNNADYNSGDYLFTAERADEVWVIRRTNSSQDTFRKAEKSKGLLFERIKLYSKGFKGDRVICCLWAIISKNSKTEEYYHEYLVNKKDVKNFPSEDIISGIKFRG
jgi:Tol biopolymer transport system component